MLEWIISSSVLIAVIVALRFVLKGKISLRLQYALWALVLVRLLLPISLGDSRISVMNPVENSQVYQDVIVHVPGTSEPVIPNLPQAGNTQPTVPGIGIPPVTGSDSGSYPEYNDGSEQNTPGLTDPPVTGDVPPVQEIPPVQETPPVTELPSDSGSDAEQTVDWTAVLRGVWIGGAVLFGAWFGFTNLLFALRVRKQRVALQGAQKLPMYVCAALDTPCLFGLFRPAIYLTDEVASDERTMRHAVEHELTHYRHGDHIWAVLRCVCIAVHWYNPLVWLAAILSRNDAELACDDSTIRRLGESERAEYGRTLLRLTCEKRAHIMTTATTMTGSGKTIKERIALIVRKPKMALYTLIAVLLIAAIAVACTFTGAEDKVDEGDDPADNITEDGGTEDGGETEISAEIAYVLQLLETLKTEDVTGYSSNMQADTEIIVPLVNATAATYAGEYDMDYEWEWHVDLHLAERNDDSGYSPELVGFHIGLSEGIVDVSCRLNPDTDPSDYVYIRLYSEELWDYIFALYNPDGIDQHALDLYEDILAERAAQTIAYHNTTMVERGFPAFTGYEITYLRLVDSFHYTYSFRVFSFSIVYLTDDPAPGQYAWPQDARPDEQGRICGYDLSSYFVAAHMHDDLVDYGYLQDYEGYDLLLNLRMDAVESVTGEKVRLDYKRAEDGGCLYTCEGASISIPYNFEHLVEAHRDSDTWCYGLVMNPTFYLEDPYLTDQALFNLFHLCEYSEDGGGLIFSIRRYTEEEYQTMYRNSYSRQQVFARDDTYYYCVFIPTKTSEEDPETAAIIAALLDKQLEKILANMIELNGWRAYAGGEESEPQFSDMSIVPVNFHQIFDVRMQEVVDRHNEVCEERNQCAFTGYQFLTFQLKDTFTRDGAEYQVYHWEVAFLTDDPNPDQSQWVGSTFVDDQNRINYYDTDTFFVVCREKDHIKWDFFHYDLYSDPQDIVFDLLAEHFAALEMEEQEIYIAAHDRLSNLTAEDVKAAFDDDSHRLDASELAGKVSAAMEHHILWPTGGVFPWNLRVYLSGGPDSYNPNVDEYMTLSVYERENIVNIRYHSKNGEHVTLVCEDAELYRYVFWLCTSGGDTLPVLTLSETVAALDLPDAVVAYAAEYVQGVIDSLRESGANPTDGVSYYSITKAEITGIEQIPTGSVSLTDAINLYNVRYRLLVDYPDRVSVSGLALNNGWLTTVWQSPEYPYILMHVDWSTGEEVWTRICITNYGTIQNEYGTQDMLAQYGSPYRAAAIELYQKYKPANLPNPWDEPITLPVTLPVLTLSDKEYESACTAIMIDLKSGWWKGGEALADCTYEGAAFECVYRETEGYVERFYGYAGYFRFDENGNCVEYWKSPAIVTLDAYTQQYYNVWWPGDGAYYEQDIIARFPDTIAEFVAEPDEERARVIRDRLMAMARADMIPATSQDTLNRLSLLTVEDIKYVVASIDTPGAAEIIAALGPALVNRVEHEEFGIDGMFWTLEFYLSGGPGGYSSQTDEWVCLYAGLEENIVWIWHKEPYHTVVKFFVENKALYQLIRGSYTTETVIDQGAFAQYGKFVRARAQETVDQSRKDAEEYDIMPYIGYEILQFEKIDSFEADGARYEVYRWNVAFLHNDPAKVCWAGGMWLDSELRVRDCESDVYFVVRVSGDTVEHGFFHWELYLGPDEETGRENAHADIVKGFAGGR